MAKIRELVLDLAVLGKLTQQDPTDESAERLIERAVTAGWNASNTEKYQQLYTDACQRLSKAKLPKLPNGWAWTCSVVIGDTSPRVDSHDDAQVAFAPMHLLPTDYRSTLTPEIRRWQDVKKGYTHFADGDIAFAKITPCFQNGKGCIFADLPSGIGAGTTELHVLRPFAGVILPLYALLFFKSPRFVIGGVASFSGTAGQQRVANDYFRFAPIPLPPLAEQKRIVAKVDELMALCDQLEALQQERETQQAALARESLARFADEPTPANLNFLFHPTYTIIPADLRKSILTLAVQGKLVPQDPNDEPVDVRGKPSRAAQNGEELPKHWVLSSLTDIAEEIVDCPHSTPKWTSSGKICVRTSQFRPGFLDLSVTKFVSVETFEERIQRLRPQENDFLYSREGGILGVACRVPANTELCLGQRMMLIRSGRLVLPPYLELVLNAPLITEIARNQTTGGAAPRVTVSTVKSYPIPIPPIAEQRRIVAKVEQLMALVDELETQLAVSRDTAAGLLSALVAELTAA